MIRYDVFCALNPDENYPSSLYNLSLNGVKYDLPLLTPVCDALLEVLIRSGEFERVEKFCSPSGMQKVRSDLLTLETANQSPAYAGCEVLESISGPDIAVGYALHQAAVNVSAARKILHLAAEGGTFEKEMDAWIVEHLAYFTFCGGFEIARMYYTLTLMRRPS